MKNQIKILALPAILFLASCGDEKKPAEAGKADIIPVKVLAVQGGASAGTISLSGQLTTDDEVYLSFKTGGIINKVLVKEGDAVKQGQLLATLNLTEINAGVQQAQLAFEKAQRDYQRAQNLYNDSVATLEQLQNAKTGLEIARQALSSAQFNRSYSEIHAPKSGYILRKMANEGQMVGPGTPVLQTNGAQSGNWILKVGAGDAEWSSISINDKAEIAVGNDDSKTFEGTVVRKSESTDPYTGTFTVDIRLNSKDYSGLASGMFGKAIIKVGKSVKAADTWAVPYDALLDGDGSTGYLFVTNDGKTAQRVKVTIGGMKKDEVIITDGLQGVQQVIVSGSAYLADKSPIKIVR